MENLGSLAILLAFCVAIYATLACVIGRIRRKPFLVVSGERAVYSIWALITLASAILVYSLLTGDFRFSYVAEHSNRTMPTLYKFAAWWGARKARSSSGAGSFPRTPPSSPSPTAAGIAT